MKNVRNEKNVITQRMSNILGNAVDHFRECHQTFGVFSQNIPGNVLKHSREICQTFYGMLPTVGVNKDNYWAESYLESCYKSTMELFLENS